VPAAYEQARLRFELAEAIRARREELAGALGLTLNVSLAPAERRSA
jgi:hypothetical protein